MNNSIYKECVYCHKKRTLNSFNIEHCQFQRDDVNQIRCDINCCVYCLDKCTYCGRIGCRDAFSDLKTLIPMCRLCATGFLEKIFMEYPDLKKQYANEKYYMGCIKHLPHGNKYKSEDIIIKEVVKESKNDFFKISSNHK